MHAFSSMAHLDAPSLMALLRHPNLVDKFSICASLTDDLYLRELVVPMEVSSSSSSETELLKRKRRKKAYPEDIPVPQAPVRSSSSSSQANRKSRTLAELAQDSEIDEMEAKEGFIDERSGETIYLIKRVIKYEPKYGYFVDWEGFDETQRSWQAPKDMPLAFADEMREARLRYRDSMRRATSEEE